MHAEPVLALLNSDDGSDSPERQRLFGAMRRQSPTVNLRRQDRHTEWTSDVAGPRGITGTSGEGSTLLEPAPILRTRNQTDRQRERQGEGRRENGG